MTKSERLRRLAELEARLKIQPELRRFLRCANDGAWIGEGPPDGELRPTDEVFEILWITPTGEYGGRPVPAEELAERRAARRPAAADEGTELSPGCSSGLDRG